MDRRNRLSAGCILLWTGCLGIHILSCVTKTPACPQHLASEQHGYMSRHFLQCRKPSQKGCLMQECIGTFSQIFPVWGNLLLVFTTSQVDLHHCPPQVSPSSSWSIFQLQCAETQLLWIPVFSWNNCQKTFFVFFAASLVSSLPAPTSAAIAWAEAVEGPGVGLSSSGAIAMSWVSDRGSSVDAKLNSSSTQSSVYLVLRYSRMVCLIFLVSSVSSDFHLQDFSVEQGQHGF